MILQLNKPRFRKAIAFLDYDWTLVRPKTGGTFPKDVDDWVWWRKSVPRKLEELYKKGYGLVIVTNQSKDWKVEQIEKVLSTLNLPMTICIARKKEHYKPSLHVWEEAFSAEKRERMDKKKSFFCGDALGRPQDYDDGDKKFAEALGIRAIPPEEFFPLSKKRSAERLQPKKSQEIVIMVGVQGSGKTTIAKDVFGSAGYKIAHGDELKTSAKMIKKAKEWVADGKSVVFDATNPAKKKRAEYIDFAKSKSLPVRCVYVDTPLNIAQERNAQREKPVPPVAYGNYRKYFEMPTEDEGCRVHVVHQ